MDPDVHPTPTALLARTRMVHAIRAAADAELAQLACAWADAHPDLDERPPRVPARLGPDWVADHTDALSAGDADVDSLVPGVDWAAGASFAAAVGMSTQAGEGLIRDALVLRHRLPQVWARVVTGEVPVWRARRIAQAVYARPADVADYLDTHVAAVAERVGTVTVDRLVDEAMLRLHAEERELAQLEDLDATYVRVQESSINHTGIAEATLRAEWKDLSDFDTTLTDVAHRLEPVHAGEPFAARRARALGVLADPARAAALLAGLDPSSPDFPPTRYGIHLVVHTTTDTLTGASEVARLETATGGAGRALLAQQVATWCGQPGARIKVTPVIDLTHPAAVDRYEVGNRLRTRMTLQHPTCVFPWCTRPARACDADHVIPHNKAGPTSDDNLAPLCRRHHRLKTKTPWTYQTLDHGTWLWTDPHGLTYLRNHNGTRALAASRVPARAG
jgi:hypothetical protein